MVLGPDRADGRQDELGALLSSERLKFVSLDWPEVEGLLDQQRPVDEVGLRRDQRQADPISTKVIQREKRLESGNAAAHDDDPCSVCLRNLAHHPHRSGVSTIRQSYRHRVAEWTRGSRSRSSSLWPSR